MLSCEHTSFFGFSGSRQDEYEWSHFFINQVSFSSTGVAPSPWPSGFWKNRSVMGNRIFYSPWPNDFFKNRSATVTNTRWWKTDLVNEKVTSITLILSGSRKSKKWRLLILAYFRILFLWRLFHRHLFEK